MAIVLSDISKQFGEHLVVNHVSLRVENGELFVLLGSSGSGKSTLLRIIAGLLAPDHGRVELHDRDVTRLPPQQRGTGFVFQNYAIFRHMTVAANVEFGLRIRRVARAERRRRCDALLEMVGLGGLGGRMPNQLSGGQRQRVALARALAYEPAVLLLDEPFGALDVKIRAQLRRSLKEIQRELKVTSILVTHDQEEAFEVGDRIGVIDRGRLVETGTPEDLYYQPKSEFVAAFLGGGNVIVGRADKGGIRLGAAELPFPAGAPAHEEGAPVRILFRPETVLHRKQPFGPGAGTITVGQGRVIERAFAGPIERLRFELETLQGTRPLAPALAYGQRFANIEATQPSRGPGGGEAAEVGQQRWIGLSRYHVLQPSALKFLAYIDDAETSRPALEISRLLGLASHGSTTLLKVAPASTPLEAAQKELQAERSAIAPRGEPRFDIRARQGQVTREIAREIQEGYYDLVVLSRPEGDASLLGRAAQLTRRVLIQGGAPVLLASRPGAAIERMLICTAAGEPGKTDVRFAARLARHIRSATTVFHAARAHASAEEMERVKRHLGQAQEMLAAYNVKNEVRIGKEPVIEAIMSEIERTGYDMVVIGAPAGDSLRGSSDLVSKLVTRINTSVLIVPMIESE